ncbi:DsbA family protein [Marinithermus hydrothermalis]|uniref:DSBA oxidoreductase n=1 Tax=Marinithermus hydrothermalis (strain DSM 14884 / JCM 11576 / T1) TaxID=869210 RepID=F2NLH4_MARHT|nr:thioredoxin [Marinithermus hydrothermalis]AEB12073.1 DSBA oxidoreductase [Marinithermus hydrothermalis DSM 14884]
MRTLLVLWCFAIPAFAQISLPPEAFLNTLGLPPAPGLTHTYGPASLTLETLDGLVYRVHYTGPPDDYTRAGEVIAAAVQAPSVIEAFADWMRENAPRLSGQGPVLVGLGDAHALTLELHDVLRLSVGPVMVPETQFGPARHVLGSGPVAIREYSDFECPFCARLHREVLPELKARYITTGLARFEYRHFPLYRIHREAIPAAEASECAAEQGAFWAFHDTLFTLGVGDYLKAAQAAGLDLEAFKTCYAERRYRARVEAALAEAERLGLRGTPTVFVGPFKLPNPYDLEAYGRYIRMAQALK